MNKIASFFNNPSKFFKKDFFELSFVYLLVYYLVIVLGLLGVAIVYNNFLEGIILLSFLVILFLVYNIFLKFLSIILDLTFSLNNIFKLNLLGFAFFYLSILGVIFFLTISIIGIKNITRVTYTKAVVLTLISCLICFVLSSLFIVSLVFRF